MQSSDLLATITSVLPAQGKSCVGVSSDSCSRDGAEALHRKLAGSNAASAFAPAPHKPKRSHEPIPLDPLAVLN